MQAQVFRGGDKVSTENKLQKDLLKLFAYSTLANFMVNIAKGEVDDDEAGAMLRLQNDLIQEFDKTLAAELDQASMEAFRTFVKKYRVRIS
jgi:hypothetical protein